MQTNFNHPKANVLSECQRVSGCDSELCGLNICECEVFIAEWKNSIAISKQMLNHLSLKSSYIIRSSQMDTEKLMGNRKTCGQPRDEVKCKFSFCVTTAASGEPVK